MKLAAKLRAQFGAAPAIVPYGLAVAFDKGFSLLTIPLMAHRLPATEMGLLDVAVSLVEFLGLLMTLGLAETAIRFASIEADFRDRARRAAEILGAGLAIAAVFASVIQLFLPSAAKAIGIAVDGAALRVAVLGACATGLIELPLTWLRLSGRAWAYVRFIGLRAVVQAAATAGLLLAGFGANTLLLANGLLTLSFAGLLFVAQARDIGVAFSFAALSRIAIYGLPVVGGLLAMFLLGNCDRWFLASHVQAAEIAYYGLAAKLALVTSILYQPFLLWWSARRLVLLKEKGGAGLATAWGKGVSLLLAAALTVWIAGPIFIRAVFPANFASAADFLPYLILISVLNELCSLTNTGVYAHRHGLWVLGINGLGGVAALLGYALLIPHYGVLGAIAATIVAQIVRLALFARAGHRFHRAPYPWRQAALASLLAIAAVHYAPGADDPVAAVAWLALSLAALGLFLLRLRLILPPAPLLSLGGIWGTALKRRPPLPHG